MFKTMQDLITYFYAPKTNRDVKTAINKLDKELFNRQFIHIVGTNGKGSTSKLINDALTSASKKVGMFTSPSILVQNERISVNNQLISDNEILTIANKYYDLIMKYQLNFFDIWFIIALEYFKDQEVEYAIIEAGIGGMHDTTNCLTNAIVGLTNVSLDHTEILGNTVEEILADKLGVCTNAQICFTTEMLVDDQLYNGKIRKIQDVYVDKLALLGNHQKSNAMLAYEILKYLKIDEKIIKDSFSKTVFLGRISRVDNLILDGAHNESGIQALVAYLKTVEEDFEIVIGVSKNREIEMFMKHLKTLNKKIYYTADDFYAKVENKQFESIALNELDKNKLYVYTGSLYFVSEVLKCINHGKSFT